MYFSLRLPYLRHDLRHRTYVQHPSVSRTKPRPLTSLTTHTSHRPRGGGVIRHACEHTCSRPTGSGSGQECLWSRDDLQTLVRTGKQWKDCRFRTIVFARGGRRSDGFWSEIQKTQTDGNNHLIRRFIWKLTLIVQIKDVNNSNLDYFFNLSVKMFVWVWNSMNRLHLNILRDPSVKRKRSPYCPCWCCGRQLGSTSRCDRPCWSERRTHKECPVSGCRWPRRLSGRSGKSTSCFSPCSGRCRTWGWTKETCWRTAGGPQGSVLPPS